MSAVSAMGAPPQSTIARLRESPLGGPDRQPAKGNSHEHNIFFDSAKQLGDHVR